MQTKTRNTLLVGTLTAAFLAACNAPLSEPVAPSNPQADTRASVPVTVTTDAAQLEQNVQRGGTVALQAIPGRIGIQSVSALNVQYKFEKVAQVLPPTVGGFDLRATQVQVQGSKVYVSYTREGSSFAGALDVFDVSDPVNPKLELRALLPDTKVNTAIPANGSIFLGGARPQKISGLDSPSVLLELKAKNGGYDARQTGMPGWAGTGLVAVGSKLFFTSGNSACYGEGERVGGTGTLELPSLKRVSLEAHCYAQSVDVSAAGSDEDEDHDGEDNDRDGHEVETDSGGLKIQSSSTSSGESEHEDDDDDHEDDGVSRVVSLEASSNGKLRVYELKNGVIKGASKTLSIGRVAPEEGRNTVDVAGNLAFVAMGESGVKAFNLKDMNATAVYSLEPDATDPDLLANGVAYSDGLVYTAFGSGGLRVARLPETGTRLELLGQLGLGDGSSANFVTIAKDLIFVASGKGGLSIARRIKQEIKSEFPDNTLKPILECVSDNGNGTLTGHFGYINGNAFPVSVPVGNLNKFDSAAATLNRGQPVVFQPGRTPYYPNAAFKVVFPATEVRVWNLKGRTSAASNNPVSKCR
jgi:hypothetical protein